MGVETLVELQRPGALDIFVSTRGWEAPARGVREATVDGRGVGRVLHDGGEASRKGTSICQWEGRGLARCERTAFLLFPVAKEENIAGSDRAAVDACIGRLGADRPKGFGWRAGA